MSAKSDDQQPCDDGKSRASSIKRLICQPSSCLGEVLDLALAVAPAPMPRRPLHQRVKPTPPACHPVLERLTPDVLGLVHWHDLDRKAVAPRAPRSREAVVIRDCQLHANNPSCELTADR